MARPAVLITGATGGLGRAFARLFTREGYDLILVARSAERLRALEAELGGVQAARIVAIVSALGDPAAPARIVQGVAAAGLTVDVLVNNAGFPTHGDFVQSDAAQQLDMIQVNVAALTHVTRLILPGMVARRRGRVLNMASTAAFQPGPMMAVYYATKAYVLSFSEALAEELRGTGVTVTALCPGPTATGFQAAAGIEHTLLIRSGALMMDAAAVAEIGYRGLLAGRSVVVPGWRNVLGTILVRLLPRRVVTAILRRLQDRRAVRP